MDSGLLILPFFRQKQSPLLHPTEQSSLNYFASAWCALENMLLAATAEGLGTAFHIPVHDEAEKIKEIVGAPDGLPCGKRLPTQTKGNPHRGKDS